MVVLWGGRPGIDYYVGSRADMLRKARLERELRLWRAFARHAAASAEAIRALGVPAAEVARRLAALGRALDGASKIRIPDKRGRTCTCGAGAGPVAISRHDEDCPMRGINDLEAPA
jgi:hypothetical protein